MSKRDITVCLVVLVGRSEENFIRFYNSLVAQTKYPDRVIIVYDIQYTTIRLNNLFRHGKIKDKLNSNIVELEYKGTIKQPAMRNMAVEMSVEDYIWFVDDDVALENTCCSVLLEMIQNDEMKMEKIACIAGRIFDINCEDSYRKLKRPIYLSIHRGATGYYNWDFGEYKKDIYKWVLIGGKRYPIIPFAQGTNMVFDREAICSIGGFNENLGIGYSSYEDSEPCMALAQRGYRTIYNPYMKLTHFKMPRVGGAARTDTDLYYEYTLSRNYALSVLSNNYPSLVRKYVYIIIFSLVQPIRIIKYFKIENKKINIKTLISTYKSVWKGSFEGYKNRKAVRSSLRI